MMVTLIRFLTGLAFSLTLSLYINAQTQPNPYNLASGPYHFNSWDSLSPAGTFPESMVLQFIPANQTGPFYNDPGFDYHCPYNMTKRPRFIGQMENGLSFLTTSSSQYNDCVSGTATDRFMGSAVLALNTLNRNNIKVGWTSETLLPGDGNGDPANPRIWNIRLQYRIGNTGDFTDVPGPVEFVAGTSTGDATNFSPTLLPSPCCNVPIVQLRWIYFESSAGNGGTRPKLRLDDIVVTSDAAVGIDDFTSNILKIYPIPASNYFTLGDNTSRFGVVRIYDVTGNVIVEKAIEKHQGKVDCSMLLPGLYIIQVEDRWTGYKLSGKLLVE